MSESINAQEFVSKLRSVQYRHATGDWYQLQNTYGKPDAWTCPIVQLTKSNAPTLDEILQSRAERGETIKQLTADRDRLAARVKELEEENKRLQHDVERHITIAGEAYDELDRIERKAWKP